MSNKIEYRLEPVLLQKEDEKKEAGKKLAEKREILAEIQREIVEIQEDIKSRKEEKKEKESAFFEKLVNEGMIAKEIQVHNLKIKAMDLDIQDLYDKLEMKKTEEQRAFQDIERAKEILIEATKEYKILEKHKENFIKEQQSILLKKEQKEMDEISNLIHNFKKKGDD